MDKVLAMYLRLSVSDDEQDESNSIKAQREMIHQYINQRKEFN